MKVLFLNPPYFPMFSRESRSPCVTKSSTLYWPMFMAYAAGCVEEDGNEIQVIDSPAMDLDPQKLREYFDFARELVAAAGRITLNYFRTALEVERKPDASPVTIADRETEMFIRSEILAKYSDHGVLGEEFGESNPDAPFRWIVDPIDGTQAFIHGVPLYTVLLALEFERDAVLGIVHCPPQNETVAAAQGSRAGGRRAHGGRVQHRHRAPAAHEAGRPAAAADGCARCA